MADSKVLALAAKTTITGAEVYNNDGGTSKNATVTNLVVGGGTTLKDTYDGALITLVEGVFQDTRL
jgi:hypothetical protein